MDTVHLGIGHHWIPLPWRLVQWSLPRATRKTGRKLGGLDDDHRRVHHFVVRELPRLAEPMSPDTIVAELGMEHPAPLDSLNTPPRG